MRWIDFRDSLIANDVLRFRGNTRHYNNTMTPYARHVGTIYDFLAQLVRRRAYRTRSLRLRIRSMRLLRFGDEPMQESCTHETTLFACRRALRVNRGAVGGVGAFGQAPGSREAREAARRTAQTTHDGEKHRADGWGGAESPNPFLLFFACLRERRALRANRGAVGGVGAFGQAPGSRKAPEATRRTANHTRWRKASRRRMGARRTPTSAATRPQACGGVPSSGSADRPG